MTTSNPDKICYRCSRHLGIPSSRAGSLRDNYGICAACSTALDFEVGAIGSPQRPPAALTTGANLLEAVINRETEEERE